MPDGRILGVVAAGQFQSAGFPSRQQVRGSSTGAKSSRRGCRCDEIADFRFQIGFQTGLQTGVTMC